MSVSIPYFRLSECNHGVILNPDHGSLNQEHRQICRRAHNTTRQRRWLAAGIVRHLV